MDVDDRGFGDLLDQAEQLTATIDSSGELPRVERNLKQLLEVGQHLWKRTAHIGVGREATDVKASVLLGSKGVSLPKISPKLEALSVAKTLEPIEPLPETDVEGFLRNERENTILSIIDETRTNAFNRAEKIYWDNMEFEWEQQKQKILNSFVGSSQDVSDVKINLETSVSEPSNIRTRSAMDNIEMLYAKEVYMYNERVIQGGIKPNLATQFANVAAQIDDKNVSDMWAMVQCMIEVPVKIGEDTLAVRVSPAMQAGFVNQARKYLESTYLKYVRLTVYGNLQQAVLGGIPGMQQLICSFLNVKLPSSIPGLEDGKVDGHPVWATIYFCLRIGHLPTALKVTATAGSALDEFRPYLVEYAHNDERRLSPRSESLIRILYRRSVHTSSDPFKRAVYCIIGCCDVKEDHSNIADKIDDYLWIKLSQIRVHSPGEVAASDYLTLPQLQTKLLEEYGEGHFRAHQQPFLYFQVLFLTAQFESAIEFLSRIDRLRCHAVHIALSMYEAKLLAVPQVIHAQMISKDPADLPPMRRLNFVRLVTLYTRKFEATDPREALQYFYFLRNLRGPKNENVFMTCVSELALETREFDMLLGQIELNGCRRPGLIDKFGGDAQKVIEAIAKDSESRGMLEDAVQLYDLAKMHENVLDLLVKLLGQVASQPNVPQSRRDRLHRMAVSIAERYKTQGHSANRDTAATFYLLLDIMTFFDTFHDNKHQDALDILKKLKLIPFQSEEIEQYVSAFRDFSDEIRRCLPDLLLAAMSCLHSLFIAAKSSAPKVLSAGPQFSGSGAGGSDKFMSYLQKQAQTLITFGGMVPYRMPGDTIARLVQKEMLMY